MGMMHPNIRLAYERARAEVPQEEPDKKDAPKPERAAKGAPADADRDAEVEMCGSCS